MAMELRWFFENATLRWLMRGKWRLSDGLASAGCGRKARAVGTGGVFGIDGASEIGYASAATEFIQSAPRFLSSVTYASSPQELRPS
jgi:hypothetical protein